MKRAEKYCDAAVDRLNRCAEEADEIKSEMWSAQKKGVSESKLLKNILGEQADDSLPGSREVMNLLGSMLDLNELATGKSVADEPIMRYHMMQAQDNDMKYADSLVDLAHSLATAGEDSRKKVRGIVATGVPDTAHERRNQRRLIEDELDGLTQLEQAASHPIEELQKISRPYRDDT